MSRITIGLFLTVLATAVALQAQAQRTFVSAGVSYLRPSGALADSVGLNSGVQFDVRYIWSPTRHWQFGIGGSWTSAALGMTSQGDRSSTSLSITQITLTSAWRPLKHGWSPFIGLEGGFGYLIPPDSLTALPAFESTLRATAAAIAGISVPLSERVDIAASARFSYLPASVPLDLRSLTLGLVYRIR
ncbi:MAG: hypothetical protein FGM33_09525 [Candidatus Kapabacteria bacterium]|nr:hypothetical protein [Candidatus Kapabacteria bacterium]